MFQCLQPEDFTQAHSEMHLLNTKVVAFEPSNIYQMNAKVENNK